MNWSDLPIDTRSDLHDKLDGSLTKGLVNRREYLQFSLALGVGLVGATAVADKLAAGQQNQAGNAAAAKNHASYDVIICGAGTSGCTLAGRLVAAGLKVLQIEAGNWDDVESVRKPGLWFTNLGGPLDWGDIAVPTPSVNNLPIASHMAKVLGGGSSINATIWVRPPKADFDGWAQIAGDTKWNHDSATEVFKRVEDWHGPASINRGTGGPVWVQRAEGVLSLSTDMLQACRNQGLPVFEDLNGQRELGIGGFALMNQIIKEGRRVNMAQAYVYPILDHPNYTLLTGTRVLRLISNGRNVRGVRVAGSDGSSRDYFADGEVVLSMGAIRTPQVLMLSGIGDREHLTTMGIKTQLNAPEVGRNLDDHILHGGVIWETLEPYDYVNSAANASGFWKSRPDLDRPDLNMVQIELPYASETIAQQYNPPGNSWALCAGLVNPKSRGTVRLSSADPTAKPVVRANFLEHPDDVTALKAGIDLARRIGNDSAMAGWSKREVAPGRDLDDVAKADFVRNGTTTFFHQVGTARMGTDNAAVVSSDLTVNGMHNLRIVDGSIMPRIVTCATMATCVFIGERGADEITSTWRSNGKGNGNSLGPR